MTTDDRLVSGASSLPPNKPSGDIVERLRNPVEAWVDTKPRDDLDLSAFIEWIKGECRTAAAEIERLRREVIRVAAASPVAFKHTQRFTGAVVLDEQPQHKCEFNDKYWLEEPLFTYPPDAAATIAELQALVTKSEAERYKSCGELLNRALLAEKEVAICRDMLLNPDPDSEPDVVRLHREKCDALDRAFTAESAVAAAWEEAEDAVRKCASLDENGYICEKSAAIKSIRASAIRAAGAGKTAESGHSPSTRERG